MSDIDNLAEHDSPFRIIGDEVLSPAVRSQIRKAWMQVLSIFNADYQLKGDAGVPRITLTIRAGREFDVFVRPETDDSYSVTITSGAIAVLARLLYQSLLNKLALQHAEALPELPRAEMKVPDELDLDGHPLIYAGTLNISLKRPEHKAAFYTLLWEALRFVLAHEVAHIVRGHFGHQRLSFGHGELREAMRVVAPEDYKRLRSYELDADLIAVRNCVAINVFEQISEGKAHSTDELTCLAPQLAQSSLRKRDLLTCRTLARMIPVLAVTFFSFTQIQTIAPIDNQTTHPDPMSRLVYCISAALYHFKCLDAQRRLYPTLTVFLAKLGFRRSLDKLQRKYDVPSLATATEWAEAVKCSIKGPIRIHARYRDNSARVHRDFMESRYRLRADVESLRKEIDPTMRPFAPRGSDTLTARLGEYA